MTDTLNWPWRPFDGTMTNVHWLSWPQAFEDTTDNTLVFSIRQPADGTMTRFESIKDTLRYIWNENDNLRFCCKIITSPLLGGCYFERTANYRALAKNKYGISRRKLERYAVMADIEYRRRIRQVGKRRCRDPHDQTTWNETAKDQSQNSFFARLPVELRLKIYERVLCDQEELAIKFNQDESWDYWNVRIEPGCDAAMLRVCKMIYCEAAPILYARNTFRFDSYKLLFIFTSTIPPQRLASIQHIVLNITLFWNSSDGFTGLYRDLVPLLGGMQGLKEVCLRYRLRENSYVSYPRLGDFTLLEWLEEEERPRGYAMFYEMLEVQTGPEIGGVLFDRWAVGKRRKVTMTG